MYVCICDFYYVRLNLYFLNLIYKFTLKLIEVVLLIASSCKPVYFSVYKAILNAIKNMEFKLKSSYFVFA